ncbi:hypothetical protein AXF42_Ash006661 [Apostasia shenzhenica]|uniref:Uncharacterized protein n=1 Tax=Apostasia shenzhenica TaxID=1088818 RepID=A0A2I0AIT2_9ASPA|nr:hypothetical protein AXF42_Ash006661 [Apostasia shenzhenica]
MPLVKTMLSQIPEGFAAELINGAGLLPLLSPLISNHRISASSSLSLFSGFSRRKGWDESKDGEEEIAARRPLARMAKADCHLREKEQREMGKKYLQRHSTKF